MESIQHFDLLNGRIKRRVIVDAQYSFFLLRHDLLKSMHREYLTIKQLGGITYRQVNYWTKTGLLNEPRNSKIGWRRFAYIDYIWILILNELRAFGISNEKISAIRKNLFLWADNNKTRIPLFEFYIWKVLKLQAPVFLIVFSDGKCELATDDELNESQNEFESGFLAIRLHGILARAHKNDSLNHLLMKKEHITTDEKQVIQLIRNGEYDKIELKTPHGKIKRIIVTKNNIHSKEKLINLINEHAYQQINVSVQGKNIVNISQDISLFNKSTESRDDNMPS